MSESKPDSSPETPSAEGSAVAEDTSGQDDKGLTRPAREKPVEVGGRDGPDPVRYGDWEKGGRCIDF